MTLLAPTSRPIPTAWTERMNQKPNTEGEFRIHSLNAVCSMVWRKAGGRLHSSR
jgi:hypothetical protein